MTVTFSEGTCFYVPADDHYYVIISDPKQNDQEIVHVNFTTFDSASPINDAYNDQSCMLYKDEHPRVHHTSCICYSGAQIASTFTLRRRYQNRKLFMESPFGHDLLGRVRAGANKSQHLLPAAWQILVDQNLI